MWATREVAMSLPAMAVPRLCNWLLDLCTVRWEEVKCSFIPGNVRYWDDKGMAVDEERAVGDHW